MVPAATLRSMMSAWIRIVRTTPRPRDVRVLSAAVALVAAHALADTLVAPEPGTGAGDHLVPAFVTLAVLVVSVAVFARGRDGLRAAVAIVLGLLALEGFAIAVSDASANGPHGDNWSGFLLLPAGLVLCGLGVVLLWRSRKPEGHRVLRRAALCLLAVAGAYYVVAPLAVAILATHRPRDTAAVGNLGRPSESVSIRTADSLDLRATYVPSRNGAAVILYPASPARAPLARVLVRHGYGVLLLQMRGYGTSEGDPNMFGWGATRDLDAAVAYLANRRDVRPGSVGGIGFSVGGEQLLEAAATNDGLRAVVSEGAGTRSIREALLRGPAGWPALPMEAVETGAVAALTGRLPPPSLASTIGEVAPTPVYLIFAGHPAGGEDLQPRYFEAAKGPAILWRVSEASHTDAFGARASEYERRVTRFLDTTLLRSASG